MATDTTASSSGIRALFLNVMITLLISLSVFAVFTLVYIVPKISGMDLQVSSQANDIQTLSGQVKDAQNEVEALKASNDALKAALAAQAAAAAAAVPAPTPAPAPVMAGKK